MIWRSIPSFAKLGRRLVGASLVVLAAVAGAGGASTPDEDSEARAVLAERMCEAAQASPPQGAAAEAMLRQSADLLAEACRLNATEPRYPRLLAEAMAQLHDTAGEIDAWKAYRRIVPDDRAAQVRLIDLYFGRLETGDAKLKYLNSLLQQPNIPDEVKSHLAVRAAPLLLDRSPEQASAMIDRAVHLYASPEALRLRYRMVLAGRGAPERVDGLLAMLRANPVQPEAIEELADVLANVPLVDSSLAWYAAGMEVRRKTDVPPTRGAIVNYGAELIIGGQTQGADRLAAQMLTVDPNDADFWFIRLTAARGSENKEQNTQLLGDAQNAFGARWLDVNSQIIAGPGAEPPAAPTTGPVVAPEPGPALQRLKTDDRPELKEAMISTLADLTWFELYFDRKPDAAAPWLAALKTILPADDLILLRLEGWFELVAGHADNARALLEKAQEKDALSALGVLELKAADKTTRAPAEQLAGRLLLQNPSGVVGAIVWEAASSRGMKRPPAPAFAAGIEAALEKFPRDWFQIIDQPNGFYLMRAEPLQISHRFNEPMLGTVTIQNMTDYDLAIGPDGVIHPQLWFDALLRTAVPVSLPGAAFDRIVGQVVLHPHASISQVVRLDQGALAAALRARPEASVIITVSVTTNPRAGRDAQGNSAVTPGVCGYRVWFSKKFARDAASLSTVAGRGKIYEDLGSGTPVQKMTDLDLLTAAVKNLSAAAGSDDKARAQKMEFAEMLARSRSDAVSAISAWATYDSVLVTGSARILSSLTDSSDAGTRMLGVLAARSLKLADAKPALDAMASSDHDALVKDFAAAVLRQMLVAATQPTTAPSAEPGPAAPAPDAAPPSESTPPSSAPPPP